MNRNSSAGFGLLGLAAVAALLFGLHRFLPSLFRFALIGISIIGILLLVLIGLVIFFTVQGSKEKQTAASSREGELLSKGRESLMEIRRLTVKIKNGTIREKSGQICKTIEKTLQELKEQPKDIPTVRQCLNYYLPTLEGILKKYCKLEESGVPAAEMTEKTISCLGDIQLAMQRQYENLFEDDMLDLTVEMEALKLACRRDGLL